MTRPGTALRFLASATLALGLTITVAADTIRLKDGSIIKGEIVSFTNGRFVVVVGEGSRRRELTLDAVEIASIEFEEPAVPGSKESSIVPVSTRPAPKVVTTDSAPVTEPARQPQTQRTQAATPPVTRSNTTTTQPVNPTRTSTTAANPVTVNVKVLADNTANGWTNSGWIVKKGQRIRVSGAGSVSLGRGRTSPPSGIADIEDDQKLLKSVPTGALLAVIGDDNNDFIYIGEEREFTAGRDGALYLGINEGNLVDNSGSFDVKVEILPGN